MRDVRLGMEPLIDPMTRILTDDAETFRFHDGFNRVSDLSIEDAGLADRDGGLQRGLGGRDEFGRLFVDLADRVRCVEVTVEA